MGSLSSSVQVDFQHWNLLSLNFASIDVVCYGTRFRFDNNRIKVQKLYFYLFLICYCLFFRSRLHKLPCNCSMKCTNRSSQQNLFLLEANFSTIFEIEARQFFFLPKIWALLDWLFIWVLDLFYLFFTSRSLSYWIPFVCWETSIWKCRFSLFTSPRWALS